MLWRTGLVTAFHVICALDFAAGQTIRLLEEFATKGPTDAPFSIISSMIAVDSGRVVVSDAESSTLYLWNPRSSDIKILARRGDGPGEVRQPTIMAHLPEGGFAVYDPVRSGIHLFNKDLRFDRLLHIIGVISNPKDMLFLPDWSFVIAGGKLSDPRHLHYFDSSGRRVAAFGDPSPHLSSFSAKIQAAGGALALRTSGGILFSYSAPLRIVQFRRPFVDPAILVEDTKILPELHEDSVYEQGSRPGSRRFLWWHDQTTALIPLPDGRMINVITRYYRGDSVWDLYDASGKLISRTVVDRAWYPHDLIGADRIVASYRDRATDEHVATIVRLELTRD